MQDERDWKNCLCFQAIPLYTSPHFTELSGVAGTFHKDGYLLQSQPQRLGTGFTISLSCQKATALYDQCLIRPAGRIDRDLIVSEKPNLDQIVATLGLKEMTQGTLIRKLCTYTAPNPTRRAVFEFDKLIRSIYTLRYLRDPQLERNVHRSQNRIESYHQLRSTIAQVGGKKELTGRTDIEIEISNQCARLIANAVIFYNSAILSRLLMKYEASGNAKAHALLTQISPAAWRHILLNGHYTFQSDGKMIDLDALVAGLELG